MSNLLSFDESGFQFAWDATSLSAFATCPRKYQLSHLEGWQPDHRSVHLVFGGVYASALEHFAKHLASGMTRDEATVQIIRDALVETWDHDRDEDGNRIQDTGSSWESNHPAKTRETLIRTIVWYLEEFKDDTMKTHLLSDGKAGVEYSFALPIGPNEDGYVYCGHMDKVVEYGDGKYVQDQKTTGTPITPQFFKSFSPDMQMSGYTWAGSIIFDTAIAGVVIDAAQIAVGFSRFARGFVHRSAQNTQEWYDNTLAIIGEAKRAHETGMYRMNPTACGNFGGCQFREICKRAPQHRNGLLEVSFKRQPRWDPLARR